MLIECDADTYLGYIQDDPVRPNLFPDDTVRFTAPFKVFADIDVGRDGVRVNAILCGVIVPGVICTTEATLQELAESGEDIAEMVKNLSDGVSPESVAHIFTPYSMWSYSKGSGKRILNALLEVLPFMHPEVTHCITMSPQTSMAAEFHLSNGAKILSFNDESINYTYGIGGGLTTNNDNQIH